jgi:hypothetical protein
VEEARGGQGSHSPPTATEAGPVHFVSESRHLDRFYVFEVHDELDLVEEGPWGAENRAISISAGGQGVGAWPR